MIMKNQMQKHMENEMDIGLVLRQMYLEGQVTK